MKNPKQAGEKPDENQENEAATGETDAAMILKADHREVESLFEKYRSAKSATEKIRLVQNICKLLVVHALLEEEIFYAACRENGVDHSTMDEAQVEHDTAKLLIAELMKEKLSDDYFDAKVTVLSEYIKHHVGEEEEPSDGIFAKAQKAGMDMDALGQKIQARKSQLLEGMQSNAFAPPRPRSLHPQPAWKQSQESTMPRYSSDNERDERGRFVSDDDRGRGGYQGGRWREDDNDHHGYASQNRDRDENGRFMSHDDDRGSSHRGRNMDRDRDDNGRFMGHDDDYRRGSSRYDGNNERDRDENGRFVSHDERGGMYRSRPARDDGDHRGSTSRNLDRDDNGRFMSDERYDRNRDDDRNGGSRGHGGWYGDSRGHSEATQRGWDDRQSGHRYDHDDDRPRRSFSSGYDDDRRGNGDRGWYGDPEGHAEAARRGWRNR
jgi:hypothetical protein